jgi:serine/threonine protein kinase
VLGYPEEEELQFINNENTLNYMKRMPKTKPLIKLDDRFPNASPLAIDLLKKMLRFSPTNRITVKEAIEHPYFD